VIDALKALSEELRQRVLAEGKLASSGANAELKERIAKANATAKTAPINSELNGQPGSMDGVAGTLAVGAKLLPRTPGPPPVQPPGPGTAAQAQAFALAGGKGDALQPEDWVSRWCKQCKIDATTERSFRQIHPEAQRRLVDEGPLGANPSLELMARIHRYQAWEHSYHVTDFLRRHYVDLLAESAFRNLSMEQQRTILSYGPLVSRDPSGELMARIRGFIGGRQADATAKPPDRIKDIKQTAQARRSRSREKSSRGSSASRSRSPAKAGKDEQPGLGPSEISAVSAGNAVSATNGASAS